MGRLDGKFALITGGTSGIGLETARQFLLEGATVAITGRNEQGLAQAKAQLGEVLAIKSDAGDVADQQQLSAFLQGQWPRLDILFVNAGDVTHQPLDAWDEASYDRVMNTNVKGPLFLIQALQPMLTSPSSVILCGSVSARIGLPLSSVYAASKAALLSLARTLSAELLVKGIRVNSLSPGPTETPALNKLGAGNADEALKEEIRKLVPLGRLGSTTELAKAAVYLASDESAYVVGTDLLVAGGVGTL